MGRLWSNMLKVVMLSVNHVQQKLLNKELDTSFPKLNIGIKTINMQTPVHNISDDWNGVPYFAELINDEIVVTVTPQLH